MTTTGPEQVYRYGCRDELPRRSIRGFDHVNRFWDPIRGMVTAKILPGEYYATRADELVSTVLGSCVSACIWDPMAGVGGMNHFMIPEAGRLERDSVATIEAPARYGIFAMELLVNTILKNGGDRDRLLVKIAGGGRVVAIETGIGERNIEFVQRYVADEGLTLVGAHVGGNIARKVIFHPVSGRAEVLAIRETRNDTVARRERDYAAHFTPPSPGEIELFEEQVMDQRARKIRVLIVDDSALVRKVMMEIFASDPAIDVVGTASDPYAARERIKELNPDVLTLDVEMPKMDGITFLGNLMRLRPMPVVMVSSLTEGGADVTLAALELGAVDYITKPKLDVAQGLQAYADELIAKVKSAALARPRTARAVNPEHQAPKVGVMTRVRATDRLLAIGASTGGTEAIREVLEAMPADAPPTLITQHIPEAFSKPFADRLDRHSQMKVAEATHGTQILPGHAYVAPGNRHLRVKRDGARYICQLDDSGPVNRHKPSVDVLFDSVADQIGVNAVAVLLTGMGADGARGLKRILDAGAPTIAQDEATSVVWGMPGEAVKLGGAREVLPLGKIAHRVLELVNQ